MKKTMLRSLCLVLALLMIGAVFVSCKKDGDGASGSTAPVNPDATNLHQALGMEIRDYKGQEMKIWYSYVEGYRWSAKPLDVKLEETETDIIYKAGYNRNQEMKNRIGVDMVYTVNQGYSGADATQLRTLRTGGSLADYNIVFTQMKVAGGLALEGFFADLATSTHVKATASHYESKLNEQIKIGTKQYFAIGYHSWGNTAATGMTWANMQIIEEKSDVTKEDLYQLALDKKLTLDKMIEIGRCNYVPETGNTDWKTAKLSFIMSYNSASPLFYELGGKPIEYNAAQNQYVSVIKDQKNIDILKKIHEKVRDNTEVMLVRNDEHDKAFFAGTAPFIVQNSYSIEDLLANAIAEKVVFLPTPLYAEGEEYNSFAHPEELNVGGIPVDAAAVDFDKTSYLYEFFMVACYELVYPAVYEKSFKTRYQPDETSREVFEICQQSKSTDLAAAYSMYGESGGIAAAVRTGSSPASSTSKIDIALKLNLKTINAMLKS